MDIDIISTYFPELSELSEEKLRDTRARVVNYLTRGWPDQDMRPNSPFGDQIVTPFTYLVAAAETAQGRFMSDLDLENVSKGIIYNCDFVRKFLKNFAIVEQATLQSSGIVRLTFEADQAYTIDRRARYQFGTDVFELRLPQAGPLYIKPVGSPADPLTNSRNLVEISDGIYVVDLAVTGIMNTEIMAGDIGSTDFLPDGLLQIQALTAFQSGLPPESLAVLAQKTRETYYSASLNTPGGVRRFLTKEFPDLTGISAVTTGDSEMTRDIVNPLGFSDGRMDVYVRSNGYAFTETQLVRIPWVPQLDRFVGELVLSHAPYLIDSITAVSDESLVLDDKGGSQIIFSKSRDYNRAPMFAAGYTSLEQLWLSVAMPRDTGHEPLIPLDIDSLGNQSAVFKVVFRTDPMRDVVEQTLGSRDNAPVGVDVLVRGFVPIIIESLTVRYTRARGTTMTLESARTEIHDFLTQVSYPRPYSDGRIYDAMLYAGATDIQSILCKARVAWSVADVAIPPGVPDPVQDHAAALAGACRPLSIELGDSRGLVPVYRDVNLANHSATFEAIGPRNTAYIIDADAIQFEEI